MSYILDALRKSERERQLSQVPTLKSEHTLEIHTPKSKLPLIVTILVVSNIGILSLYLLNQDSSTDSRQSDSMGKEISSQSVNTGPKAMQAKKLIQPNTLVARSPDPQNNKSNKQASRLIPKTPRLVRVSSNKLKATKSIRKPINASPPSMKPKPPSLKTSDTIASNPLKKSGQPVDSENVKQLGTANGKNLELAKATKSRIKKMRSSQRRKPNNAVVSRIDRIPTLRMMSREFQQRLPEMKVNVYAYSADPSERFVIVNMDKYRAGQRIADGPVLQEITAESMILKFSGKRFRLERP